MARWWTWPTLADLTRFWCINCHNGGLDPPWRTSLGDFRASVQGILRFVWPGGQKDTFRKRCPFGAGAANNLRLPNHFRCWAILLRIVALFGREAKGHLSEKTVWRRGGKQPTPPQQLSILGEFHAFFLLLAGGQKSFWRGGDLTRLAMLATRQSHSLCSITPRHGVPTEDNCFVTI